MISYGWCNLYYFQNFSYSINNTVCRTKLKLYVEDIMLLSMISNHSEIITMWGGAGVEGWWVISAKVRRFGVHRFGQNSKNNIQYT